jgi:hypothetical protein
VQMTLRGRDDRVSATTVVPALGAWKPAKDAGFHIFTATETAAVKLGQTAKSAPIVHFYRFSCRTQKTLYEQIGMQVIVEPLSQDKAVYGYSKRVASGNPAPPAVIGMT